MESNENNEFFDMMGLYRSADSKDGELFEELKQLIHAEVTQGGHTYIPDEFEFRASSIAYCRRKILLNKNPEIFLNEKMMDLLPVFDHNEVNFNASIPGQLIHEIIQEILSKKIGNRLAVEEEVSYKVGKAVLKGHFDLLVENKYGEKIVIDIKTTNSKRLYLPKQAHLKQLMAYQGMLRGIRGAILYVNRNNWEMSYVPQSFDKEEFSKLVIKVTELAGYESRKELPPRQPALIDECGNEFFKCNFYDFCYPDISSDDIGNFEIVDE